MHTSVSEFGQSRFVMAAAMAEEACSMFLEHLSLQQLEVKLADSLTPQVIASRRQEWLERVQTLQREQNQSI